MKKLLFLLFLLPVLASAQDRFERIAKETSTKMTEVLALNPEQTEKVYKAEFNKLEDVAKIRSSGETPEVFRPKFGIRFAAYDKELEEIIGAEKLAKWKAYEKAQKAKK